MGKRVLLLAPKFFGYYQDIASELQANGLSVDYYPDRPSDSVYFKSISKVSYKPLDIEIQHYANSLVETLVGNHYDVLLYVGGMSFCFSRSQFTRIRCASKTRFIAYLWDSLENCKRIGSCLDLFDQVFSFDPKDCTLSNVEFLPLFFTKEFDYSQSSKVGSIKYDACFVGSVHQVSKFERILRIINSIEEDGGSVFTHFYMPSRSSALLRMLQHQAYRHNALSFTPLSRLEIANIFKQSSAVIDSPQDGQRGLTMRSIEAIGSGTKLLTTNRNIVKYDFFDCGFAMLFDSSEVSAMDFIKSKSLLPEDVRQRYSITAWAETILGL